MRHDGGEHALKRKAIAVQLQLPLDEALVERLSRFASCALPTAAVDAHRNNEMSAACHGAERSRLADLCGGQLALVLGDCDGALQALRIELVASGGNVILLPVSQMPFRWLDQHRGAFSFCVIDANSFADAESLIDFCLWFREAAPGLPVLLVGKELLRHDLSAERMAICDATLHGTLRRRDLTAGLEAAFENHRQFLRTRADRAAAESTAGQSNG